jgi:L-2-hydroxyglutarate oxidase
VANKVHTADFLLIGGGIIGINIARELKHTFPGSKVTLIEKEPDCGMHASGRNSGVLHAGFYYSPDSLKARFTRNGNRALTRYCEAKKLSINKCGKLVVAKDEGDLKHLDELLARGKANGIELEEVSESEARKIEPRVRTFARAIYSPTTSTVNPAQVMESMKLDTVREGVKIHCGAAYIKREKEGVRTTKGLYRAGYYVNAAGLYADKIAKDFGFSKDYCLLPFKGLYLYSDEPAHSLKTNIYPVPDLRNPFLGVHFTMTADGRTKIGPTAIPAFWREHYSRFENFRLAELLEIITREVMLLFLANFDFGKLALEEIRKYSRQRLVALAGKLASGVERENYVKWGAPGIRAQLVNLKEKTLEMDFVLEGDSGSMHVLNAVSPAFTCSIPFAQYVSQEIKARL